MSPVVSAVVAKVWWFPVLKGIVISSTVLAVVNDHGLSGFAQALIIALVSATVGAFGMIVAALIAANEARRSREVTEAIHVQVTELKAAQGVNRRASDPPLPGKEVTK